jgi:hypothetical protein
MNRVSRTYAISYELPDAERKKLTVVYERLPGFCGYAEDGIPLWFGPGEGEKHLRASVEPSGLLVEGVLDDEAWRDWDAAFRAGASRALGFEVKDAED